MDQPAAWTDDMIYQYVTEHERHTANKIPGKIVRGDLFFCRCGRQTGVKKAL